MMYDFDWHQRHGQKTASSAHKVLSLLRQIHPFASVLDVGCGDGIWLQECSRMGCQDYLGIDGTWTRVDSLRIPKDNFITVDISEPLRLPRKFDLVLNLEVAEHVDATKSNTLIDNIVAHGDLVLFSAAIPNQGGYRHVNERWQSEWAVLFDSAGYSAFDPFRAHLWNDASIHFWYRQNVLLYVNKKNHQLMQSVKSYVEEKRISELPYDIVHPEKFSAIANYDQIAFRRLWKKLPVRTMSKMRDVVMRKI